MTRESKQVRIEKLQAILDTLSLNIAVLDSNGTIEMVNREWDNFLKINSSNPEHYKSASIGINYLNVCQSADSPGHEAFSGIRKVLKGELKEFVWEYPCHSPTEKRWFLMHVNSMPEEIGGVVISHLNITERKIAEMELEKANKKLERLSLTDGLTGLDNRRQMDRYLADEWNRAIRSKTPVSLLMIDIDFFKQFNDHYGHQEGDRCLQEVAGVIKKVVKRPVDRAARYGGEEFAIILPATDKGGAEVLAENLSWAIRERAIPHAGSKVSSTLTLSVGVSTRVPEPNSQPEELVKQADAALYKAKEQGRARWVCG